MKKIFTLVAMALMAVGVNAANRTTVWTSADAEGTLITWGGGEVTITDYQPVAGDVFVVTVSKVNSSAQAKLMTTIGDNWTWTDLTSSIAMPEAGEYKYEITTDMLDNISSHGWVFLSGENAYVSKVELESAIEYAETGTSITFDEYNQILASEFASYSDQAKVEFVVEATGEAVNDEGTSVLNWGIGSINSIDYSVKVMDLPLKKIGDNVYTLMLSDLKVALAAGPDQYGRYGLVVGIWGQGKAVCKLKSVTVYEVKTVTAINTVAKTAAVQNGARYNMAGQLVNEGYKGLAIMNGKKVVIK